jgi:hypothetical protein
MSGPADANQAAPTTGPRQEALAQLLSEADRRGHDISPELRELAAEQASLWDAVEAFLAERLAPTSFGGAA